MKKITIYLVLITFLLLPVCLQAEEMYDLDGINIENIEKVPSSIGLFFKDLKERASLYFTFDKIKKAEKRLKYAEERIRMIGKLAEKADDPRVAKKIDKIIKKADGFLKDIKTDDKDFLKDFGEKKAQFLENISKHRVNREIVLDKVEDRVPLEKLDKFRERRRVNEVTSQEFIKNLIDNDELGDDLKEVVKENSRRLRVLLKNRERTRQEVDDFLNRMRNGDETALERINKLREQRSGN